MFLGPLAARLTDCVHLGSLLHVSILSCTYLALVLVFAQGRLIGDGGSLS